VNRRLAATLAALTTTVALALVGCGATEVHGTVTSKEHDQARTEWKTEPKTKRVCTTSRRSGKTTQSCKTVADGTQRVAHYKPECWELELDTGQEVCVSEDTWHATAIGDRL
jgi:hypothetical protein